MGNRRTRTLAAAALAALATAVGCRDTATPTSPSTEGLALEENHPPPPPDEQPAFRLTGGGRVDKADHADPSKNTPESHDFATFGFQARPGSGNITWVDHNEDGLTFHGRVSEFAAIAGDGDCATFSGTGRGRRRDGTTFEEVAFTVLHACDVREPGRGADHIEIVIDIGYTRHGALSGGNIQSHKL